MKKIFLTSNLNHYHKIANKKIANEINNTNGLVGQLKKTINRFDTIVYIASNPSDIEKVTEYSNLLFEALKLSDIAFKNYYILDDRTKHNVTNYIKQADLIFLSGGDTYIQNQFFNEMNLKYLLKEYNGVIIGQSAGSINLAENVYNSPENGTNSEPVHFTGLGLTEINIEPHFNIEPSNFNELENYQRDNILGESLSKTIYALCDESHIFETDNSIVVYGQSYIIRRGIISLLCNNKESFIIK